MRSRIDPGYGRAERGTAEKDTSINPICQLDVRPPHPAPQLQLFSATQTASPLLHV